MALGKTFGKRSRLAHHIDASIFIFRQQGAAYAAMAECLLNLFWLGSLTRYQPVELFESLDGSMAILSEFLETQPKQLLYIFASAAKRQNVTRAAIV